MGRLFVKQRNSKSRTRAGRFKLDETLFVECFFILLSKESISVGTTMIFSKRFLSEKLWDISVNFIAGLGKSSDKFSCHENHGSANEKPLTACPKTGTGSYKNFYKAFIESLFVS